MPGDGGCDASQTTANTAAAARASTPQSPRRRPGLRAEYENAMGYQRWYMERMFLIAPAGAYVGNWLQSFREFPPRQKPGSFNLERVMEAVTAPHGGQ